MKNKGLFLSLLCKSLSLFFLFSAAILWAQTPIGTLVGTPIGTITPATFTDTPTFTFTPTPIPSQVFHGVDWVQTTANAGFAPRMNSASVVFDPSDGHGPRMYLLGGGVCDANPGGPVCGRFGDVWSSSNGASW